MINTRELIGNNFIFGGQICTILELWQGQVLTKEHGWLPVKGIEGIKLTEGIIIRLGFEKKTIQKNEIEFMKGGVKIYWVEHFGYGFSPKDWDIPNIEFEYLHTLQNWWYAHTKKELTLK